MNITQLVCCTLAYDCIYPRALYERTFDIRRLPPALRRKGARMKAMMAEHTRAKGAGIVNRVAAKIEELADGQYEVMFRHKDATPPYGPEVLAFWREMLSMTGVLAFFDNIDHHNVYSDEEVDMCVLGFLYTVGFRGMAFYRLVDQYQERFESLFSPIIDLANVV